MISSQRMVAVLSLIKKTERTQKLILCRYLLWYVAKYQLRYWYKNFHFCIWFRNIWTIRCQDKANKPLFNYKFWRLIIFQIWKYECCNYSYNNYSKFRTFLISDKKLLLKIWNVWNLWGPYFLTLRDWFFLLLSKFNFRNG